MMLDAPAVASERTAGAPAGATTVSPSRAAELEDVCLTHADYLYRYVCSIGLSPADAEDAVQDAFEAFFRAPLGTVKQPRAWLATVARRQGLRRASRDLPIGLGHESDHAFGQLRSHTEDVETEILQHTTVEELLRAAAAVSPEGADFLRRIAAGESAADIAQQQGMTAKGVYHRLELVRNALRRNALALASAPVPELESAVPRDTRVHARRLLDLVESLPGRQRQVLMLALGGLRPRAIAVAADISRDGARANLHYAKKKIAAQLNIPIADVLGHLRLIKDVTHQLASAS